MSRRRPSNRVVTAFCAVAALAALPACKPEGAKLPAVGDAAGPHTPGSAASGDPSRPSDTHGRAKPPAPPAEPTLPSAEPVTPAAARIAVAAAVDPQGDIDLTLAAIGYLADEGDADAVRAAAAKLLVRGEGPGGFEDPAFAAAALEALLRVGDADAAAKIVALGREAVEGEEATEEVVAALSAVAEREGSPQAAEARKLLVRMTADDFCYVEALTALALARAPEGRGRFHEVATDEAEQGLARATAVAGLLAIGDSRGAEILTRLVDPDGIEISGSEAIDGLGVRGLSEGVEPIRKLVRAAVDEGNSANETMSAAVALLEIRGVGKGTPEDLEFLRGLADHEDSMADEYVHVALWALGDASRAGDVAKALTRWVVPGSAWFDAEEAVWVLDLIAERREGGREPFSRIVDAAAAIPVPTDPARPDRAAGARRIRLAAAHARTR